MPQEEVQLFASIMNSLGVVGVLAFTWWITRQDMRDERARLEKQRLDDLARYEREINAAFTRFDRDLQIERNRADKWQAAIIGQLKRTNVPDAEQAEAEKKKGL